MQKLEWNEIFRFGIYKWGKSWKLKGESVVNDCNRSLPDSLLKDSEWQLIWLVFLILFRAKRGTFLFCPHWPLIKNKYFETLNSIKPQLEKLAKENWADFLRLNSISQNTKENKNSYKEIWFIDAPMHLHAEDTHLMDLTLSEEELLANLRKTTRYVVNRAKKEWVEIKVDNSNEALKKLVEMHFAHAKRSNWKNTYWAFSPTYIKNLVKVFWENCTVIRADFNGHTEAILMTIRFWETCVYYIWASEIRNPKFSPAYLLQWSAILKAKEEGCKIYNFWGVSPDSNPKHPIQGVSLFKRWFWGFDYSLLHAQDLVFNPLKYSFTYLIESFRRIKRGYYYKKPE